MDTRPIFFLDSGIGGLPYCYHFLKRNPHEQVIYVADRAHFPYGPKERETLTMLLTELLEDLTERFNPKLAVLACNTASVSSLGDLRERFPRFPWVGTVPAVKPAVMASRTRRVGVLGTERTIDDPYIRDLAARYGPDCALFALAAPDLVELVEQRFPASMSSPAGSSAVSAELRQAVGYYIEEFRRQGVDGIVLGCTHFLFLREAFKAAAEPDIRIYHSVEGVSRRVEALLDQMDLRSGVSEARGVSEVSEAKASLLLVTGHGSLEPVWQDRGAFFNLTVLSWEAVRNQDQTFSDFSFRRGV